MTEFLKIPVDELTDLFLKWLEGAAEALEEAYEPEQRTGSTARPKRR